MYKRSAHGLRHDAHLARAELLPAAKMRNTLIHWYVELGEQAEATTTVGMQCRIPRSWKIVNIGRNTAYLDRGALAHYGQRLCRRIW